MGLLKNDSETPAWISDLLRGAPFRRVDHNPGTRELLKLFLALLTIVPLRVVSIFCLIIGAYVGILSLLFFRDYVAPATHQKSVDALINTSIQFFAGACLIQMGFTNVTTRGKQHMQLAIQAMEDDPVIVVANHVSFIEILYLLSTPICPCFVFKKSCLNIPFISTVAVKALHCVAVDNKRVSQQVAVDKNRVSQQQRGSGTLEILKRVEAMRKGEISKRPIAIFPEGTTSNGKYLLNFRTGAFVPGCKILPVIARMPFTSFSPAYESILTSVHILRLLSQLRNQLEIDFLTVYEPKGEELSNATLFAENVRDLMATQGDLIKAPMGYHDKVQYHRYLRTLYKNLGASSYIYPRPDLVSVNKGYAYTKVYSEKREKEIVDAALCDTG